METIILRSKSELLRHAHAIEALFLECFGGRMSLDLWHWAYIDNPYSAPFISLCYDDSRLVGHYAAIPLPLANATDNIDTYLSMTTMVAASHRQHGIFVSLAQATYDQAKTEGAAFIIGFPNHLSAPGFKKKLNWDLPPIDYVAKVDKKTLLRAAAEHPNFISNTDYRLDLTNQDIREWRLSRPNSDYQLRDGLVYKKYNATIDLIAYDQVEQLNLLPDDQAINLLVSRNSLPLDKFKEFGYQFGGISLNKKFHPSTIRRQMILSDVF